jgi:hypothetical protein
MRPIKSDQMRLVKPTNMSTNAVSISEPIIFELIGGTLHKDGSGTTIATFSDSPDLLLNVPVHAGTVFQIKQGDAVVTNLKVSEIGKDLHVRLPNAGTVVLVNYVPLCYEGQCALIGNPDPKVAKTDENDNELAITSKAQVKKESVAVKDEAVVDTSVVMDTISQQRLGRYEEAGNSFSHFGLVHVDDEADDDDDGIGWWLGLPSLLIGGGVVAAITEDSNNGPSGGGAALAKIEAYNNGDGVNPTALTVPTMKLHGSRALPKTIWRRSMPQSWPRIPAVPTPSQKFRLMLIR